MLLDWSDMMADLTILHNGGGVQTGTMVEMIADGILPKPDAVISADTGNEPSYIYQQWQRDKEILASIHVPFLMVNNGNILDDLYSGKRFAAMPLFTRQYTDIEGFGLSGQSYRDGKMKRQCTSEYKIVPIEREIRTMLLEMGLAKESKNGRIYINRGVIVESWIGYTTDEIERVNRMKQAKWQHFRFPLIELKMTKADCVQWLKDNDKPPRLSSACAICPLIGNAQRRQIRDNDPIGWKRAIKFDNDLRNGDLRIAVTAKGDLYLSDKFIPLSQLNIDEEENRPTLFQCMNLGCAT